MEAVYSINDRIYTIVNCTNEDVDKHYELIKDNVSDTDETVYKNAMLDSIKQNMAYKAICDNDDVAWLYVHKVINACLGSSIYKKDLIGMLLVFKEFSEHTNCKIIRYTPHKGMLSALKSLATKESIRLYHNGESYIRINLNEIIPKFEQLYNKLGIKIVSRS